MTSRVRCGMSGVGGGDASMRECGDTGGPDRRGGREFGAFEDEPFVACGRPDRYTSAKARKNYADISPITRASDKKKVALARFVHNDRLIDVLATQAFSALSWSPGARAYYDRQRARNAALRQLANRLVDILHGCLKTGTLYHEAAAWPQHVEKDTAA
ncbi:hypothetical protein ACQP1G_16725 [Nocardia sp. CA-107356]|uniref:hypothetical protein n=1 Tax=Nocardia sp. CA-107356 TaxID=3239972 RepID=UPI003D8D9870